MREYRAILSGQRGKYHREVIEDNVAIPSACVPAETSHLISPYQSYWSGTTIVYGLQLHVYSNPNNTQQPIMLVVPQEEWQSLHDKLDRLTEIIERNQNINSDTDWLESEDARKILGVSPKTWQNYRDQRLIPFSQIGRKIYVNRADLDAFLLQHRIGNK